MADPNKPTTEADIRNRIADLENQQKQVDLTEQQKKQISNLLEEENKRLKIIQQIIVLQQKDIEDGEKRKTISKFLLDRETDKAEQKRLNKEIAKEEYNIALASYRQAIDQGITDEEILEARKKRFETAKKEYETLEKINNLEKEREKKLNQIGEAAKQMTGQLGSQILNLTKLNGLAGIFGSMVDEVVKSQQSLAKNFASIGFDLKKMTEGVSQFGVGVTEATAAANALYSGMNAFSSLNENVRNSLIQNVAKMENLGVSAATSAKNFNELNKGLGFSAVQVGNLSDKIVKALGPAGISPAKALGDLNAILPQVSASGKKAVDIYIELQKQAKALGMEVTELGSIVGQSFDTFEGAADKAGKLNAILGGDYLNSVEMLNATEEERVKIMREAFEQSGKDFDSMDRFEKKAIVTALGLKDAAQARKLFGNLSIEEQIQMARQERSQRDLEKAQIASADAMRQLTLAFSSFMVAVQPLAELLKKVAVTLSEYPTATSIIIPALVALKTLGFNPLGAVLGFVGNKIGSVLSKITKLSGATPDLKNNLDSVGSSAKSNVGSVLAFGAAMMMVGAGIGLAAWGLSTLVAAFNGVKESGMALAAVGVVMLGFVLIVGIMALVATKAVVPIAGLGFALLLIGGAIAIASLGLAELVKSFNNLNESQAAAAITAIGLAILGFVGIIAILVLSSKGLVIAASAIGIFALAIIGTLFAIKLVKDDWAEFGLAVKNVGDGVTSLVASLSQLSLIDTTGLEKTKKGLLEIKEMINSMSGEAEFTAKVNNIKTFSESILQVSKVETAKVQPATNFVNAAKEYQIAQANNVSSTTDKLFEIIKGMNTPEKTTSSPATSNQPVIIYIDDATSLSGYIDNQLALKKR